MLEMRWNFSLEAITVPLSIGLSRVIFSPIPTISYASSVVQPPPDQQGYTRVGIFYFCVTDDNVKLAPLTDSPLLQRVGFQRRFDDDNAPTMEIWRKGRTSAYGKSDLKAGSDENTEEEVIAGVVIKHYN